MPREMHNASFEFFMIRRLTLLLLLTLLLQGCATIAITTALIPTMFTPQLIATSIASGAISGVTRSQIERVIRDRRANLYVRCQSQFTGQWVTVAYAADNPTTTVCHMSRRKLQAALRHGRG
jgi:hypothetical protein